MTFIDMWLAVYVILFAISRGFQFKWTFLVVSVKFTLQAVFQFDWFL